MASYDDIATAAATYGRAREQERLDPRLSASEEVLRARAALAEALLSAGWLPDGEASRHLLRDRALLAEHRGVLDLEDLQRRPPAGGRAD